MVGIRRVVAIHAPLKINSQPYEIGESYETKRQQKRSIICSQNTRHAIQKYEDAKSASHHRMQSDIPTQKSIGRHRHKNVTKCKSASSSRCTSRDMLVRTYSSPHSQDWCPCQGLARSGTCRPMHGERRVEPNLTADIQIYNGVVTGLNDEAFVIGIEKGAKPTNIA